MRYLPKSPADREAMLKAIGALEFDGLFHPFCQYRLARDLKVPRQIAESEIVALVPSCGPKKTATITPVSSVRELYFHYRRGD